MSDSTLFQLAKKDPPWLMMRPNDGPRIHLATRLLLGRNAATAVDSDNDYMGITHNIHLL